MITVAICDDQNAFLKWMKVEVIACLDELGVNDTEILCFDNPHLFLDSINSRGGVDIAILDILMPGINGTELAKEIRTRHDGTAIIFISSSKDYAVEAFALNAIHYITKPFSRDELKGALERAVYPLLAVKPKKIHLNLGNGIYRNIDISSIDYIESVGYRRVVHAGHERLEEMRRALADFQEELQLLSPGQFFRLHRWCILNLDAVKAISVEKVLLRYGEEIPMRNGTFRILREKFFDWSFKEKEAR